MIIGRQDIRAKPALVPERFESIATLTAAAACAAVVAAALRIAWNPPLYTYTEYVPISAVLAALAAERSLTGHLTSRDALIDGLVVALTAMRVVVPPLPLVSGHALLSAYGALTARRWPLRALATLVVLHVIYTKLFVTGGWLSMVAGFGVATVLAAIRRPERPLLH